MSDSTPAAAAVPAAAPADVSLRRRETQARLFDAATEVFAELGFQGASVENICTRANFSRGAFYSNFSSKEELFVALLRREYDGRAARIRAQVDALVEQLNDATQVVSLKDAASYVVAFLAHTGREPMWFTLETEFLLLTLRDPNGPLEYFEFNSMFRDELGPLAEDLIRSAGRRFTLPRDHALAALTGIHDQALRATVLLGDDTEDGLQHLGERMAELLFAITEQV